MPKALDPERREAIEQDIRDGTKSRNQIARDHNVAGSTITNIAKTLEPQLGHPAFDRSATKNATEARLVDNRAARERLRELLLEDAHRLRRQLWVPCVMHNFGGKDNTHNSIELDQPTFDQQRQIMTSVGICVDKIVRLDQADDAKGEQAAALLDRLVSSLEAAAGAP